MKTRYRSRWEPTLLSLLLPGAGQFLAGRRVVGVAWFLALTVTPALAVWTACSPRFPSLLPTVLLLGGSLLAWLFMLVDASRSTPRGAIGAHQPALAGLLSAFVPGLGQCYNRRWLKSLLLFLLFGAGLVVQLAAGRLPLRFSPSLFVPAVGLLYGGLVLFALYEAYCSRSIRLTGKAPLARQLLVAGTLGLLGELLATAALTSSVQAFKIPSASMMPTLSGEHFEPATGEPRLLTSCWHGEWPVRVLAKASGVVEEESADSGRGYVFRIGTELHVVPPGLTIEIRPGDTVQVDQVLAAGVRKAGDHVLVDKRTYHHATPQRGDVVVFSTEGMDDPRVIKPTFYVKRIVGLPGETVQIKSTHLYIDGHKVTEPPILDDIANGRHDHHGFRLAQPLAQPRPRLATDDDRLVLGPDEFAVFGDNSPSSLDSRYFGPIRREAIIGKVVRCYWPFDRAKLVR